MFDAWIRDHARWRPRAPAVVTPARTANYAAFDADIDRMAGWLAGQGVSPTAGVVCVAVVEPYDSLVALGALARLGVASSPPRDLAADLRLTTEAQPPDGAPRLRLDPAWASAPPSPPSAAPPRPADGLGRVLLSSGTTGAPKRVGLTWGRLEASVQAASRIYGGARGGVWIAQTSPATLFGNIITLTAWSLGAAVGLGFPPADLPDALERLSPGLLGLTPGALGDLLRALPPGFRPQPGWRIVSCGAPLPVAVGQEASVRISPDLVINYGATEHTFIASAPFAAVADTPGAVGWPPAGAEVDILGPDGRPVPEGQGGELRVRGARASARYLGDAAASAARFGPDGWLTGDLGWRRADGCLVLEGRVDDRMVIAGHRKLAPETLEAPARAFPGVADCAAFAVPGPDGFDEAWLAVAAPDDADRDGLARALAATAGLPPVTIAWVSVVPRNAMGKVERARLRAAVMGLRPDD